MAAIDMFVVVTATFRLLYALIVLGHYRRRVIHFEVTENPTQDWLARRMTEAFLCQSRLGVSTMWAARSSMSFMFNPDTAPYLVAFCRSAEAAAQKLAVE